MADENTTAEDLIAEIREAASDSTAGEAEIFAQEARQEVAQAVNSPYTVAPRALRDVVDSSR
jgi:hypothetical protein